MESHQNEIFYTNKNISTNKIKIELTEIGIFVKNEIQNTNKIRQNVKIEKYIIMPNHVHLILEIFDDVNGYNQVDGNNYEDNGNILKDSDNNGYDNENNCQGNENNYQGTVPRAPTVEKFGKPTSKTVCTVVRFLKAGVTRTFNKKNKCDMQIWQRNYYEHVIKNEIEYQKICEYIKQNPQRWIEKYE